MKTTGTLCALLLVWASTSFAQQADNSDGELSGYVFSDFYWMASSHNENIEGSNGFWIRRVYFTYDRRISDSFSARFRLEGNSEGDFLTEAKINPVVKDLYLRWQTERHQVLAGISPTPTWGLVEDVWGYRSVEKTPLDIFNFGSSRDFGIAVNGVLDPDGKLNYHFMLANGSSNASETNKGKKILLSLSYALTEHIVVELYGDWNNNPLNRDWFTLQGFAAYRSDALNVGVLFAHQNRNDAISLVPGSRSDLNLEVVSLFANFEIEGQIDGFVRVDHSFDAVPGVQQNDYFPISNQAESTVLIGGVDIDLGSDIHLMPNLEAAFYSESELTGNTPDSDLIPRLTLFYNF